MNIQLVVLRLTEYRVRGQINRAVLDFDFEKVCSVSLSNINIYGCLVCGKYFQGRGRNSYAFAHAIHDDHHVFINLETKKVRSYGRYSQSPSCKINILILLGVCPTRRLPCLRPIFGRYRLCSGTFLHTGVHIYAFHPGASPKTFVRSVKQVIYPRLHWFEQYQTQ